MAGQVDSDDALAMFGGEPSIPYVYYMRLPIHNMADGMSDDDIDEVVHDIINTMMASIPERKNDLRENGEMFMARDPDEFLYGMTIGLVLGMTSMFFSSGGEAPSMDDQRKITSIINDSIPEIRERVFD